MFLKLVKKLKILRLLFDEEDYSDVVREAQMVEKRAEIILLW